MGSCKTMGTRKRTIWQLGDGDESHPAPRLTPRKRSFLGDGLIHDMVITTIPVPIGGGRPLFGALKQDITLELPSSRSFPSGLVQSAYRLAR